MFRPSPPPPVAVGDHAMVRPDAPKHYGANLGYTQGEVVGIPWLCKRPDSSVDDTRTCVLVQFATGELVMFPLSELSVIPNLEARRGEVV